MSNKLLLITGIALTALLSCKKELKQIVKEAEAATFIIYTYDEFGAPNGLGSGFFIDNKGTCITNFHVLEGATKAIIKTSDEKEYEIDSIIASDKKWDIVKFSIKTNNTNFTYLNFAKKEPEKGEKVYNISSPLGLEKTVTEGILSSFRNDKQHGEVVQVTAPISAGSSGSAILDKNGDIFAVATYIKRGGQNLNFGVLVNEEKINNLTKSDFKKHNSKFNSKSRFVILNIPATIGSELTLNAIEFGKSATILYLTYTNLNLATGNTSIYIELGKKDKEFTIENIDSRKDYYVTSSTIGIDKDNASEVKLATSVKFKVYFPEIKHNLQNFNVYGCGKYDNRWQFRDIDLDSFRNTLNVNFENYKRDYAISNLSDGKWSESKSLLTEFLENNPKDALSLNTMGIISYLSDNNSDAIDYFTESIEANPNDDLAYINRSEVYSQQGKFTLAIHDVSKAINIVPKQDSNYFQRARLYIKTEEWEKAKVDLDYLVSTESHKKIAMVYFYRSLTLIMLNKKYAACEDIYTAFQLTNNKKMEKDLQDLWKRSGCD